MEPFKNMQYTKQIGQYGQTQLLLHIPHTINISISIMFSQFVIKGKAPMCGDFTFTVQPMLLDFNTVTCPIRPNHATVADQHKVLYKALLEQVKNHLLRLSRVELLDEGVPGCLSPFFPFRSSQLSQEGFAWKFNLFGSGWCHRNQKKN